MGSLMVRGISMVFYLKRQSVLRKADSYIRVLFVTLQALSDAPGVTRKRDEVSNRVRLVPFPVNFPEESRSYKVKITNTEPIRHGRYSI